MPYIKSGDGRREALQRGEPALNAGELNYQIFYFVKHNYLHTILTPKEYGDKLIYFVNQFLGDNPNYQRYNDMTGALIRCQKELERRLKLPRDESGILIILMNCYDNKIAEYEDLKCTENGDVE
jgi:hypothetical protein